MSNLTDNILFALCIVLFIIGVHQTFVNGIGVSYGLFMLSLSLLFLVRFRRAKRTEKAAKSQLKRKEKERNNEYLPIGHHFTQPCSQDFSRVRKSLLLVQASYKLSYKTNKASFPVVS